MCVGDFVSLRYGNETNSVGGSTGYGGNSAQSNRRGVFGVGTDAAFAKNRKLREILDGLSNTIMLGEKANAVDASDVRGLTATDVSDDSTHACNSLAKERTTRVRRDAAAVDPRARSSARARCAFCKGC
jgi:hypothetical protein